MKRYTFALVALAALVAFSSPLFAQDGKMMLGVKGGLNSANLRVKSDVTVSTFQSYNAFVWGGFIAYRLSGLFSVQLEGLNNPKGSKLQQAISGSNYDTTLMYKYTEIPLLIKLAQGQMGKLAPSLYAGPYWAKLREAKIRAKSGRDDITEELTRLESHYQQFDDGAASGEAVGRMLDFLAQAVTGLPDIVQVKQEPFIHLDLDIGHGGQNSAVGRQEALILEIAFQEGGRRPQGYGRRPRRALLSQPLL